MTPRPVCPPSPTTLPQAGNPGEREQRVVSLTAQLTAARSREAALEARAVELMGHVEDREKQVRVGGRQGAREGVGGSASSHFLSVCVWVCLQACVRARVWV